MSEQLLGQWVQEPRHPRARSSFSSRARTRRSATRATCTRSCTRASTGLQIDYVDIYMMHRDNPDVPVGEFVDVLNEHVRAGRMQASSAAPTGRIERVQAANDYATRTGSQGFARGQQQLQPRADGRPRRAGCIGRADADVARLVHEHADAAVRLVAARPAASSPARAPATSPTTGAGPLLVQRRQLRATGTRARDGEEAQAWLPINIALAYVLNQPFPTFPLIGPRALRETRTSLPALDIELTAAELRWLNLED